MIYQCGGDGKVRTLNCLICVSVCVYFCVSVCLSTSIGITVYFTVIEPLSLRETQILYSVLPSILPSFLSFLLLYDKSHHITQHNKLSYHVTPLPAPAPPYTTSHHITHHHTIPHHTISAISASTPEQANNQEGKESTALHFRSAVRRQAVDLLPHCAKWPCHIISSHRQVVYCRPLL